MAIRKTTFSWLIVAGVGLVLALIVNSEVHTADLQSEGRVFEILRSFELRHVTLEGKISDSRTFTITDYKEMEALAELSMQECDQLIHFNDRFKDEASAARKKQTVAMCEDYANRLKVVHDFRETNFKLRSLIDEADGLSRRLASNPSTFAVSGLLNQFLADDYPWITHSETLRTALSTLQKTSPHNSKASQETLEALADVQEMVTAIDERLRMEKVITDPAFDVMLENLRLSYVKTYVEHTDRTEKIRLFQSIFSGVLMSLMGFVLIKLNTATHNLNHLNQTLEDKVEKRTEELREVLSQLEDQQQVLAQSAKMSALGEMAGGIAHEINTPLAAISLHAELLTLDAVELEQPQMVEGLASISRIIEKISKIVVGLKRFSRTGEAGAKSRVSFVSILDDTLLLCSEKLKVRGIELKITNEAGSALIDCAPEQISQILLNLLNNAVDALETSAVKRITLSSSIVDSQLVVSVADSGPGIPLELRNKLMQPFFTTKAVGKGTGLGLSISKGIANSHGGILSFDPEAAETCFVLRLPLAQPISQTARAA